jgi:hypothetical protein
MIARRRFSRRRELGRGLLQALFSALIVSDSRLERLETL